MKNIKFKINNQKFFAIAALVIAIFLFAVIRFFMPETRSLQVLQMPQEKKLNTKLKKNFDSKQYINLPILMYHHVGELPKNPSSLRKNLTVSVKDFELQVAWLKGQGFQSVLLSDLLKISEGDVNEIPEKSVIFTFDDGYKDAFENAVPVLKKYGFKGNFAVITQFPGILVGDNEYANWELIKKAKADGMEIISHTQDHFDGINPKYTNGFILRNLKDSQTDIFSNLGKNFPILVYPFGHYNQNYLDLTKEAGFKIGVTTKPGKLINLQNLLEVPRIRVYGGESLEIFKKSIRD